MPLHITFHEYALELLIMPKTWYTARTIAQRIDADTS